MYNINLTGLWLPVTQYYDFYSDEGHTKVPYCWVNSLVTGAWLPVTQVCVQFPVCRGFGAFSPINFFIPTFNKIHSVQFIG